MRGSEAGVAGHRRRGGGMVVVVLMLVLMVMWRRRGRRGWGSRGMVGERWVGARVELAQQALPL